MSADAKESISKTVTERVLVTPERKMEVVKFVEEQVLVTPAKKKKIVEIVEHQQTGLVTENANQKAFTSAINTLCSSPMSLKEMGANGYRVFCEKFNATNMVAQYAHLYREITGR